MNTHMQMYPPVRQLRPYDPVEPWVRAEAREQATRGRAAKPPRYRQALLTWVAAYPIITVILAVLGPEIARWPLALRTLVISVLMVAALTWLIMPTLTRAAGRWLRPA
jgi:antibiotic biosynthesis monooxygenase (ABM) superfamily enzyme